MTYFFFFCMQYYHLADKFARGFEEAYLALRRMEDSKADLERIPSVDEKLQLSYDIFKVRREEWIDIRADDSVVWHVEHHFLRL